MTGDRPPPPGPGPVIEITPEMVDAAFATLLRWKVRDVFEISPDIMADALKAAFSRIERTA